MKRFAYVVLILVSTAWAFPSLAGEPDSMAVRIQQQMDAPDRHQFDARRDKGRKPFETFRFMGIAEGMVVMDIGAYAGYTTEMLAAAVGPSGKVYSQHREEVLVTYAKGYYKRTMDERLANNRLPNVVLHISEYESLGLDAELDFAFLGNMIHDFYYRDGEQKALSFLASMRKALKPGGVLAVMDHVGEAGNDNKELHRIEPRIARDLLHKAGFVIEAESDFFTNPEDDHSLMVYNKTIYLNTDKFLFRVRKPQ